MKKYIPILLFLICQSPLQTLPRTMPFTGNDGRLFIHTDKPFYVSGGTLWFAVYHSSPDNNQAPGMLHLQLVDPGGIVQQSASYRFVQGIATGHLRLRRDLKTGCYRLAGIALGERGAVAEFLDTFPLFHDGDSTVALPLKRPGPRGSGPSLKKACNSLDIKVLTDIKPGDTLRLQLLGAGSGTLSVSVTDNDQVLFRTRPAQQNAPPRVEAGGLESIRRNGPGNPSGQLPQQETEQATPSVSEQPFLLAGTVTDDAGRPLPMVHLVLFSAGQPFFVRDMLSDGEGSFFLNYATLPAGVDFCLKPLDQDPCNSITLSTAWDVVSDRSWEPLDRDQVSDEALSYFHSHRERMLLKKAFGVAPAEGPSPEGTSPEEQEEDPHCQPFDKWSPDAIYLMDNYEPLATMGEYFREVIPFLHLHTRRGHTRIWMKFSGNTLKKGAPLFLVNGIPTKDFAFVETLDPLLIERIELFGSRRTLRPFSLMGASGVVSMVTRDCRSEHGDFSGSVPLALLHLEPEADFKQQFPADPRIPFLDDLIYWNSRIPLDRSGNGSLSFRLPDRAMEITLKIQGICGSGDTFSADTTLLITRQ